MIVHRRIKAPVCVFVCCCVFTHFTFTVSVSHKNQWRGEWQFIFT